MRKYLLLLVLSLGVMHSQAQQSGSVLSGETFTVSVQVT